MVTYRAARILRTATVLLAMAAAGRAQFIPAPNSPFPGGMSPISVAVADFNGDSHLDIAIASQSGSVSVLLGDGTGNFSAAPRATNIQIGTGSSILSFIVARDLNNDNRQDLAIANISSGNVTVLLGNGDGSFTPAPHSPFAVGTNPNSIAVGDFNGDSIPDLAVANLGSRNVTILLGSLTGQFTPSATSPLPAGNGPSSIAEGDFNNDGIADLAISNQLDNTVTLLLGKGGASFVSAPASPFAAGASPGFVAVVDFNGDNNPDLAIANIDGNTITVLFGNGAGGFTPGASASANSPVAIAIADFNGDYLPDIAVADQNTNNISVLLGSGTGGFKGASNSPFAAGTSPRAIALGDFNEDGRPDLAIADLSGASITVLLNITTTTPMMLSSVGNLATTAPSSIVTIWGTGLAPSTGTAPTVVTVTDSSGATSQPLTLFYAGPTQINALMPQYIATGNATFSVLNPLLPNLPQKGTITISTVAPALFTMNGGKGVAAAQYVSNFLVNSTPQNAFTCPPTPCLPALIDVSSGAAALILYGTGIRNRSSLSAVTVTINGQALTPFYAGMAPGSPGEDQVNVLLPGSLKGSGVVFVTIAIGAMTSNQATLLF
jgi:uncharacterized protein (TIGR03437 family)